MLITNKIISLVLQICGQLLVGLSVAWLINGGGLWFLIPWVLGWNLYRLYLIN